MLNNKAKLFLTLSIILIAMMGISAVSAVDVDNATTSQVDTSLTDVQQTDNMIGDTNKVSEQSIESTDSIAKKTNDMRNSLTAGEKTIADLNTEISEIGEGGTLVLEDDYTESSDTAVSLSEITIDGNGRTIDFANYGGRWTIGTNVVIKNVVFQNYNSTSTPLFYVKNGTFTLDNVTVKDCNVSSSSSSEIIHDDDYSNITILNSNFDNIQCYQVVYEYGRLSNMTINNSVFNHIDSKNGAIRIYVASVNASITNSNFTNNYATNYGAAIDSYRGAVNITGCIFINNTAETYGGALYVCSNPSRIINNTFINNTAYGVTSGNPKGRGGAIYINTNGNQYIFDNIMSGNSAFNGSDIGVNNNYKLAPVNVTVLSTTIDSDEPFVLTAYVTDNMGNSITGGTVTFTMDGNTYTANVIEGIAKSSELTGMDEDSYVVSAVYSNAAAENQTDVDGTIIYGSILPPMTDYTSLQGVLDSLEDNAVIKFKNNIERADSETKVTINKNVTINGKEFTIDANQGQIFEITNGATLTLANATLTDVNSAYGMFYVNNGNLVLNNVMMDNSTVTNGYSDYLIWAGNNNDVVAINNSKINNIAGNLIYNLGIMNINNTVIASNTGVPGVNGLIRQEGTLNVYNSNIENNTANAGIIYALNTQNGPTNIENVTFINNTINRNSIIVTRYDSTIDKSVFINNTCTGGASSSGALLASRGTISVNNSVFINNVGGDAGVATATYGIYKIENSILLRNDSNVFFYNENEESAPTAYANWYGTNDPTDIADAYYDYDDFYDEEIMALDVVIDNWRIMNVTVTPTAEDNFVGIADVTFNNLTDDEGTITTTDDSLPDGFIDVIFEANYGIFDEDQVTVTDGHAVNTYHYSMDDAKLVFTANDQVIEIDVTAPEIDLSHYTGLQIIADSTAAGETIELTENVSRTTSEDNVTITKDIIIDGKGFTVDAKGGKIFRIENAAVTLKNMILTNMSSNYGAAVYGIASSIILDNVTITNGTLINGYGDSNSFVYGDTSTSLTIKDSLIENLTGMAIGSSASVIIDNSIIQNVSVPKSSSYIMSINKGNLTITDSVINNNSATQRGIYVTQPYSDDNHVIISNSNFTNNVIKTTSGNVYGILCIDATEATVTNSQFINNTATATGTYSSANGGAIVNYGDLEITKSIFINNDISGGTYGDVFGSTIYNGYDGNLDISYSAIISDSSIAPLANGDEDNTPTANYNWWGSNNNPSDKAVGETDYYGDSCPSPDVSKWLIMNVTVTDNDDTSTITTTFNKYTDSTGTVYDTTDSIADGLEVTYQLFGGTLAADTTTVVDGVTTNTFTKDSDIYKGFVTQSDQTIPIGDIEPKEYKITNTTYPEYFNEDGTPKWVINEGSTIKLSGLFTNKNFTFNLPLIITTDEDQAILENSSIIFTRGSDNSNITSIQINDTNYAENIILISGVKNILIENMTINQYNDEGITHAIYLQDKATKVLIENNTISTVGPDANVDWSEYPLAHVVTSSISGYDTSENIIRNNTIVTMANEATPEIYGTIYGIDLSGNPMGSQCVEGNLIENNTIYTVSNVYNYGISIASKANRNKIINNNITSVGDFDAHGIQLAGPAEYNVISDNAINVTANNVTYALYVSTNMAGAVRYNNITNNNITAKSSLVYGMELWQIQRNNIINNTITGEGNYTLGIGTYGNKYDKIINNTIDVIGYEEGSSTTMDNILAETSGIKLTDSSCYNVEVTGNHIIVDSTIEQANAVNITGTSSNVVTDNYLLTSNRAGDGAVDGDATSNTISDNRPTLSAIITDETYPIYFDENGFVREDVVAPNAHLEFSGEFFNKNLTITMPLNLTTHTTQAQFYNTTIVIMNTASGTNVTDFIIFDENYAESVITVDGASDILIGNITIDQYNDKGVTHSIYLYNAANGVIIENNTISTVGPDANVEYDEDWVGHTVTASISGYGTSNNTIRNNTIVTMANGEEPETYGTIYGIDFAGNVMDDEIVVEGNVIENNTIYTESSVYNYGVSVLSNANNNKIINNNVTGVGDFDAHGIQVAGPASDNVVSGNIVNLTANNVTYGLYISTNYMGQVTDNQIYDNEITAKSHLVYGVELWSISDNKVVNNTINAEGNYTLGIGTYYITNNEIVNNTINVKGYEEGIPTTMDNILAETTGIKLTDGSENNTITGNKITVDSTIEANAVNLSSTTNNTVTDNTLETPVSIGDYAVVGDTETNTIKDNLPKKNESSITVTATTPVNVNEDVTIDISLSSNGTSLSDRIVTVIIGDEEPFDLTTTDGTVQHVYTPTKQGELNITVSFAGDRNNTEAEDQTTVIVNPLNTNIVISDIGTVKLGDTVTIDVTLSNDEDLLSGETVTLKVNDETFTNTTENGIAKFTVEFNDAGEYVIIATYDGSTVYNGSETNVTLSVEALNTTVEAIATSPVKYGANTTISGTIKDVNGVLLEGINATIYVNDVEVTNVTTDVNGAFTYNYTTDTLGLNTVTVKSIATNNYNANNCSATFEVEVLDVTITGEDVTGTALSDVTIVVSVKDENDKPVNGGTVVFTDAEGNVLGSSEVVEGSASITTVFDKKYEGIVSATYAESGIYAAGEGSVNVAISKVSTNLRIMDVDTVKIGENVIVNVVLTDEGNTLISDKTVTLTVGDETFTNTTENGVAKFTLSFEDADDYEIVASYAGDDTYEESNSTLTISVEALNTIIEADVTNVVKYGADATINGTIKDENGELLEGIEAIIYVNGVGVTTVTTDANGAFTYDYTTDTLGLNEVLIESLITNNYNSNTYTANFGVDTLNVTITGEDVTGTTLSDVTIVVSVVDENGNAVNGGTVVFTDANGKVLGSADVIEGSASITTVFTKVYDDVVTVTYAESGIYSAGEGEVNVAISKIASTVTIDPVEGVIGEVTTIVANVVDANGNPVNGGKVVFKYNGKTLKDADGNVVQANVVNGVATVDFVVPDSWRKGGNLSAKYGGTSAVDSTDSNNIIPTISLRNVTITIAPQSNTAEAGDNVIYVVVVSDEKTGAVINGVVVVKMAGVTVGTVDVVNGVGMFNYTIPTSRRAGDYNMSFVFSNSSYNRAEYDEASLTVELSQVRMEAPAVVVQGNETGVVKAQILYTNTGEVVNTPISVAIKVNGKTVDSSRYSNGNIEFELPASYKDGSTITIAVGATYRTAALRKDIQYIKIN